MEEKVLSDMKLPQDSLGLLPHRPPMLLVGQLLERAGDKAVGSAVMPDSGICFDPDFSFPEFFVEAVAQTVAMANGYDAQYAGKKINDGMLVAIDSFTFTGDVAPGKSLRIVTEMTFEFGAVKMIHGEIFCEDQSIARGDLKVWENLGQQKNE